MLLTVIGRFQQVCASSAFFLYLVELAKISQFCVTPPQEMDKPLKTLSLFNERSEQTVAQSVEVARSLSARVRGLLGRNSLPPGHALLLERCKQVHMLFMRFPIDAVFCGSDDRVVHISKHLRPWTVSRFVGGASYVIELPAGAADELDIRLNDVLQLR